MPTGGERAWLGLAVADDASDDPIGVIERGAEGVGQRIAELAPSWIEPGTSRET